MIDNNNIIGQLLYIALIVIPFQTIVGQVHTFDDTSFEEVITVFESQGLYFSYNPTALNRNTISGTYELTDPIGSFNQILSNTTFSIRAISDNEFAIVPINPITVCGILRDDLSDPVSFAHIIGRGNQVAISDDDGYFEFEAQVEITDQLNISCIGFVDKNVLVSQLLNDCPIIRLQPQLLNLGAVTVKEYITPGIEVGDGEQSKIIRPDQLQTLAGQAEPDVLLSVQLLPGIISRDGSASNINVRGGTPDQNLILWDDIPVFNTGHIFGMISAFNPHAVDAINVYSSGFKAEYGGRVSSVIEMDVLQDEYDTGADVYTDLTHFSINGQWTNPKKTIGGMVSLRKSWTEVFPSITFSRYSDKIFQLTRVDNQSEIAEFPDFNVTDQLLFSDIQSKFFARPFKNFEIGISGFTNENEYTYETTVVEEQSTRKDLLQIQNDGGKINFEYTGKKWKSALSYVVSTYDYSALVTSTSDVDQAVFRTDDKTNFLEQSNLKWKWDFDFDSTSQLGLGIDFEDIKTRYSFEGMGFRVPVERDFLSLEGAFTHIFADYDYSKNNVDISFGTRLTLTDEYDTRSFFEPRIAITYRFQPSLSFRSGIGRYYQFLNNLLVLGFSDLNDSQGLWALANDENINILKNDQWNIGAKWIKKNFLIDVEYYEKQVDGVSTHSTTAYYLPEANLSNGQTSIKGLDFLVRYRYRNLQTWLSYSYSDAFHTFEELDDPTFPTNEWVKHRLTLLFAITEGRFSFSGAFTLRSGLPYSIPNGYFENGDQGFIPIIRQFNNGILPTFQQFDVTVNYAIYANNQKKGNIGIALNNVLDHENVFLRGVYQIYIPQFQGSRSINVEKYYLRFTPNVFASWSF